MSKLIPEDWRPTDKLYVLDHLITKRIVEYIKVAKNDGASKKLISRMAYDVSRMHIEECSNLHRKKETKAKSIKNLFFDLCMLAGFYGLDVNRFVSASVLKTTLEINTISTLAIFDHLNYELDRYIADGSDLMIELYKFRTLCHYRRYLATSNQPEDKYAIKLILDRICGEMNEKIYKMQVKATDKENIESNIKDIFNLLSIMCYFRGVKYYSDFIDDTLEKVESIKMPYIVARQENIEEILR